MLYLVQDAHEVSCHYYSIKIPCSIKIPGVRGCLVQHKEGGSVSFQRRSLALARGALSFAPAPLVGSVAVVVHTARREKNSRAIE